MSHTDTGVRAAGGWLAIASLLLTGTLITHGPLQTDLGRQMQIIADGSTRWAIAHWSAAAALSSFAVAGLVVLAARSRLTEGAWTMSAWAVLPVTALWTMTTAVAEATAVADAAIAGDRPMFDAWWAFSEGKATGFMFSALALAIIAGNEARTHQRVTPAGASWIGAAAGVASFFGWALGMWLGVGIGNLIWLVSSIILCLWALWFGIALAGVGRVSTAHAGARPVSRVASPVDP